MTDIVVWRRPEVDVRDLRIGTRIRVHGLAHFVWEKPRSKDDWDYDLREGDKKNLEEYDLMDWKTKIRRPVLAYVTGLVKKWEGVYYDRIHVDRETLEETVVGHSLQRTTVHTIVLFRQDRYRAEKMCTLRQCEVI